MTILGIEKLVAGSPSSLVGRRLALLCNQASTDSSFRHSRDLVNQAFPGQLTALFAPQHGFFAEKQDNMIESAHGLDTHCQCPVFSLYGEQRKPTAEMMEGLDVLLIDLIDVGTRVYTFMWTMLYCMEAAAEHGCTVMVLDRPNPLGGLEVEGNMIADDCRSFVGLAPIPMRHGLTMGELGRYFCRVLGLDLDYQVITMDDWHGRDLFPQTGHPWLFPSPNMPSFATSMVYPGQVIWEGTNVSEGRGTTMPFEIFGAPFIQPDEVSSALAGVDLPGCLLRPLVFQPTFHKWAGEDCAGFQIHVTDFEQFRPYRTSLALLRAIASLYPEHFACKQPPYEYEFTRLPLDLIIGSTSVRKSILAGDDLMEIEEGWSGDLHEFGDERKDFFLYLRD